MSQEIMRKCPEGYREATFAELQELMNQQIVDRSIKGRIETLNAEIVAGEMTVRAAKAEMKDKLSELNLHAQAMRATNGRLGIEGVKGDVLEGDGAVYLCVDRTKRTLELPGPGVIPAEAQKTKTGGGITVEIRDAQGNVVKKETVMPTPEASARE